MTIYEITKDSMDRVFISDNARQLLMTSDGPYDRISADDIYARVHPDDRQRVLTITQSCFRQQKPFKLQFRVLYDDDHARWVQLDSKPIQNDNDDVRLFTAFSPTSARRSILKRASQN